METLTVKPFLIRPGTGKKGIPYFSDSNVQWKNEELIPDQR